MKPPTLESIRVHNVDKVPPGWFTRRELEKEWCMGESNVKRLVASAIAAGKAESKRFRVRHLNGSPGPVPHYRFK